MISIMEQNKFAIKTIRILIATALWLLIWEAASFFASDNLSIFLPSPFKVAAAFARLFTETAFWRAAGSSLLRIFCGFLLGSVGGIFIGILTASFKSADVILSPALKIIRAVPVVSFIILAFLFISVDRLPVFISFLMVVPLIWQSVHDGITGTDIKLCEMCRVYGMGKFRTLIFVRLPCVTNEIITALINGLGFAWKSGVAAEVLCTPQISIGKSIYRAKASLNFDEVYALTLTVVILSLIFEFLLKFLWRRFLKSKEVRKIAAS